MSLSPSTQKAVVSDSTEDRYLYRDPHALVALSEVTCILGYVFDQVIDYRQPYLWWNRSVSNRDISLPMPTPDGRKGGSYLWHQSNLVHWYAAWRGIPVPWMRELGDQVTMRGVSVPSVERTVWDTEVADDA